MEKTEQKPEKVWRVLIVDDDHDTLRVMRRALYLRLKDTVFIELAPGSVEGLGKVDGSLDILITDYQMPDMTGPVLIRHARAINPGLKVILMSGYSGADTRLAQAAAEDPTINILRKPFDLGELQALMATLMTPPSPF